MYPPSFFLELKFSQLFPVAMIWEDSREHCTGEGGLLLEVRTQDEFDRAAQLQLQAGIDFMWLGGKYDDARDEWVWSSNSEAIDLNVPWMSDVVQEGYGRCLEMHQGTLYGPLCSLNSNVACEFFYN